MKEGEDSEMSLDLSLRKEVVTFKSLASVLQVSEIFKKWIRRKCWPCMRYGNESMEGN